MGRRGLICISVLAETNEAILAAVTPATTLADVIEIRIDGLAEPLDDDCFAAIAKPVLVTNRPVWEGGLYAGDETTRVDGLRAALRAGAGLADIELRTEPDLFHRLLHEAHSHKARVIVSSHDFVGTPAKQELSATLEAMRTSGADIGKIVTTAASPEDALRILALQEEAMAAAFPLCAFAMGTAGTISRLATLYLGGFMTYVALSPHQATAPGQITVHDLHRLLALLERHDD